MRGRPLLGIASMVLLTATASGCSGDVGSGQQTGMSDAEIVCRRFMELKNAGDEAVNELLGPAPTIPTSAISEEEADRLDAELILRGKFRVLNVRPDKSGNGRLPSRCVLAMEGNYSESFDITTPSGPSPRSRRLTNPDIVVEVRDGKLRVIGARLHEDPNQKPLTPAEQEWLRRRLNGETK